MSTNWLRNLQKQIGDWAYDNFGKPKGMSRMEHNIFNNLHPLLGMQEELGELCHARLKAMQQIRTTENHLENEKDALGDLMIYMLDYCDRRGIDLYQVTNDTWNKIVKKRDWANNPQTGQKPGLGTIFAKREGGFDLDHVAHLPYEEWPEDAKREWQIQKGANNV